jgi:hypothetical protein
MAVPWSSYIVLHGFSGLWSSITYLESSHSYSNVYGDSNYGNYGNMGILLVIRNPGTMGIFNPIHGYMSTLINGTMAYYGYTLLNQCAMINGTILQWHIDYVQRISQWISSTLSNPTIKIGYMVSTRKHPATSSQGTRPKIFCNSQVAVGPIKSCHNWRFFGGETMQKCHSMAVTEDGKLMK